MRFYKATQFLFPRSFELRLLTICFLAVHVPLIACIAFSAATWHWQADTLLVILLATLLGTAGGVAAIHALLAPLTAATGMLRSIQKGERVDEIPVGGEDLVGRLLRGVTQAANDAADRSEELTIVAEHDSLTKILNRRGFLRAAERALVGDRPAVLALIDLDHFKTINDHLGHAAGDELLHAFAQRMSTVIRQSDICARWGGEEFAVLLPGANLSQAHDAIERLRSSISRHPLPGVGLTFSCGLAATAGSAELDDTARRADKALYSAKHHGRNRIEAAE
ncbi:GGDEF domain-containing protein [Novosphingobium sp. 9U]|uniref:GGDEF domain-containing protein n=1 Tax=Novosphingobium sp. 9U TaxID=2653158 RepID=UPI0012F3A987|nr:GGDEF domain-containing protein [Novosphingobium sp. 9U]VWX49663.1 putative Diguanylate cyclase [Novosphingobium sp. 9U]